MNNPSPSTPITLVRRVLWVAVALAALALGAALALRLENSGPVSKNDLVPQGGHFTLTDQNGRTVRDTDFAGKYRLIYFGYTFCPDVCPVDMQTIGQAWQLFAAKDAARAAKLQPIFITVDPARDTPAALKQFVSAFPGHVVGLTGPKPAIDAAVAQFGAPGHGSYARLGEPAKDGSYLVEHTRYRLLYGPNGEGIAFLPEDADAKTLAAAFDRLVK